MKGRYLFFAACLGCLAFYGARGDDDASAARAAARRVTGNSTTTANQTRQKNSVSDTSARPTATSGRNTTTSTKSNTNTGRTIGARTGTVSDSNRTAAATNTTSARTTVTQRNSQTTTVQQRATTNTAARGATVSRAATQSRQTAARTATTPVRSATSSRTRGNTATTLARAATNNDLRDAIMGRDYKSCRQVYYECMDEFCANKDAQLKRCACSSRLHEFDKVKKQLENVEDKLLDFNQRLLTVNMDKEDAAALFTATEGELAFNTKDTSASKKILDEISKKLNSSSDDSFSQSLSAISLSLNTDAAFDSVDSLMGASTTTKEGVDLYNAALPICREMAAEVCDDEALDIAESGYQMTIEQDCNTIAKTYETQTNQAREKIREGSALLDISRLDTYQKRNSDDILTCKKKILNQLYDTSVCGDGLGKCLDISGQYIDPSTGQAFLTQNLANLSTLITRPTDNQTWTSAPGNDRFVSYLNSKKKYLEPAMENCQDIADYVWEEFIDDALSQIKLAQESKLEEVRQSCTTLTAQCLTDTSDSISNFDARALSTFGVKADKTVNDMCASVRNACTALLETVGGAEDWVGGMSQIATDKTYDTIMQTCREVGRACIIQACTSISGNFGMCENIQNSINRKAIINRTSCWNEVKQCVAEAGEDAINNIFNSATTDTTKFANGGSFYTELYGVDFGEFKFSNSNNKDEPGTKYCYQTAPENDDGTKNPDGTNCIFDICTTECGCGSADKTYIKDQQVVSACSKATSFECRVCRLAEKIWGNCEATPSANIEKESAHNKILIPANSNVSTLLSWFALNTGTKDNKESCRDTSCPSGYHARLDTTNNIFCESDENYADNSYYCPASEYPRFPPLSNSNKGNCCRTGDADNITESTIKGNVSNEQCCIGSWYTPTEAAYGKALPNLNVCSNTTSPNNVTQVVGTISLNNGPTPVSLVCLGSVSGADENDTYPSGKTIKCDGQYVYVDDKGHHINPHTTDTQSFMSYINLSGNKCIYISGKWIVDGTDTPCEVPEAWMTNIPTAK